MSGLWSFGNAAGGSSTYGSIGLNVPTQRDQLYCKGKEDPSPLARTSPPVVLSEAMRLLPTAVDYFGDASSSIAGEGIETEKRNPQLTVLTEALRAGGDTDWTFLTRHPQRDDEQQGFPAPLDPVVSAPFHHATVLQGMRPAPTEEIEECPHQEGPLSEGLGESSWSRESRAPQLDPAHRLAVDVRDLMDSKMEAEAQALLLRLMNEDSEDDAGSESSTSVPHQGSFACSVNPVEASEEVLPTGTTLLPERKKEEGKSSSDETSLRKLSMLIPPPQSPEERDATAIHRTPLRNADDAPPRINIHSTLPVSNTTAAASGSVEKEISTRDSSLTVPSGTVTSTLKVNLTAVSTAAPPEPSLPQGNPVSTPTTTNTTYTLLAMPPPSIESESFKSRSDTGGARGLLSEEVQGLFDRALESAVKEMGKFTPSMMEAAVASIPPSASGTPADTAITNTTTTALSSPSFSTPPRPNALPVPVPVVPTVLGTPTPLALARTTPTTVAVAPPSVPLPQPHTTAGITASIVPPTIPSPSALRTVTPLGSFSAPTPPAEEVLAFTPPPSTTVPVPYPDRQPTVLVNASCHTTITLNSNPHTRCLSPASVAFGTPVSRTVMTPSSGMAGLTGGGESATLRGGPEDDSGALREQDLAVTHPLGRPESGVVPQIHIAARFSEHTTPPSGATRGEEVSQAGGLLGHLVASTLREDDSSEVRWREERRMLQEVEVRMSRNDEEAGSQRAVESQRNAPLAQELRRVLNFQTPFDPFLLVQPSSTAVEQTTRDDFLTPGDSMAHDAITEVEEVGTTPLPEPSLEFDGGPPPSVKITGRGSDGRDGASSRPTSRRTSLQAPQAKRTSTPSDTTTERPLEIVGVGSRSLAQRHHHAAVKPTSQSRGEEEKPRKAEPTRRSSALRGDNAATPNETSSGAFQPTQMVGFEDWSGRATTSTMRQPASTPGAKTTSATTILLSPLKDSARAEAGEATTSTPRRDTHHTHRTFSAALRLLPKEMVNTLKSEDILPERRPSSARRTASISCAFGRHSAVLLGEESETPARRPYTTTTSSASPAGRAVPQLSPACSSSTPSSTTASPAKKAVESIPQADETQGESHTRSGAGRSRSRRGPQATLTSLMVAGTGITGSTRRAPLPGAVNPTTVLTQMEQRAAARQEARERLAAQQAERDKAEQARRRKREEDIAARRVPFSHANLSAATLEKEEKGVKPRGQSSRGRAADEQSGSSRPSSAAVGRCSSATRDRTASQGRGVSRRVVPLGISGKGGPGCTTSSGRLDIKHQHHKLSSCPTASERTVRGKSASKAWRTPLVELVQTVQQAIAGVQVLSATAALYPGATAPFGVPDPFAHSSSTAETQVKEHYAALECIADDMHCLQLASKTLTRWRQTSHSFRCSGGERYTCAIGASITAKFLSKLQHRREVDAQRAKEEAQACYERDWAIAARQMAAQQPLLQAELLSRAALEQKAMQRLESLRGLAQMGYRHQKQLLRWYFVCWAERGWGRKVERDAAVYRRLMEQRARQALTLSATTPNPSAVSLGSHPTTVGSTPSSASLLRPSTIPPATTRPAGYDAASHFVDPQSSAADPLLGQAAPWTAGQLTLTQATAINSPGVAHFYHLPSAQSAVATPGSSFCYHPPSPSPLSAVTPAAPTVAAAAGWPYDHASATNSPSYGGGTAAAQTPCNTGYSHRLAPPVNSNCYGLTSTSTAAAGTTGLLGLGSTPTRSILTSPTTTACGYGLNSYDYAQAR